ncbi:hypothetical protein [Mycobacterium sp. NPDC050041]|uniref:hypothetical protein n=1 Tax=Mycobacterium sp. NPDC050041 TaxID=3364293 RepID=UPI003C301730
MSARGGAAVLAHDVGGATDLPVPLFAVLIGATGITALTFAIVAFAWKQPRFDPARPGRVLPRWATDVVDSPGIRSFSAMAALLFTALVAVSALVGPQDGENPLRGVLYALLWVGLVVISVAFGPVWRAISPMRTLYRLIGAVHNSESSRTTRGLRYPRSWGFWPAAAGLFSVVWLMLASPNLGTLAAIKYWLLAYVVAMTVGATLFGQRWFTRADPFEIASVVASRLSPFRRDVVSHRVIFGSPFDHLLSMPVRPGTLAVIAVLLGSIAFDSVSAMPLFENFVYDHEAAVPLVSEVVGGAVLRTTGLSLCIVTVAGTFWAAARAAGGSDRQLRRRLPGQMAHSLIPIFIGYFLAHYLSYLVEEGHDTLILLTDPLDRNWVVFGMTSADGNRWLSQNPAVLSTIKISCVVAGHVVAVIAAHDSALRLLTVERRVTGQLPLMLTMVGYAFAALYLLFGS